jgi:NAD(P)-dependent dehydrogenase (short-subunit alcohol dehydrogenase family)
MVPFDLAGRKALVTGAAGGIGLAIARCLAVHGASIAVADRDAGGLTRSVAQSLPASTCVLVGDVSVEAEAEALIRRAVDEMGCVDILVNNAAITEPLVATVDQSLDDWQRVIDVNLRGVYLMSRAFGRHVLGRAGRGAIVNISSIAGLQGHPASNAYGVSKAGIAHMTKSMAVEWARRGVRVNCIAPGLTDAPMAHALFAEGIDREQLVKRIPMRRLGDADEIADTVLFLASEAASYITGVVIPVDGGWSSYGGA